MLPVGFLLQQDLQLQIGKHALRAVCQVEQGIQPRKPIRLQNALARSEVGRPLVQLLNLGEHVFRELARLRHLDSADPVATLFL